MIRGTYSIVEGNAGRSTFSGKATVFWIKESRTKKMNMTFEKVVKIQVDLPYLSQSSVSVTVSDASTAVAQNGVTKLPERPSTEQAP